MTRRQEEDSTARAGDQYRCRHAICLIDVLGQKDRLAKWDTLAANGRQTGELRTVVDATVGTVRNFKKQCHVVFDGARQCTNPGRLAALPLEIQQRHRKFRECNLKIQQFADTFVFYSAVSNSSGNVSVIPVFRMLGACSMAMITSTAMQIPVRGALTLGFGVEMAKQTFYGPALAEAYHLENSVAQYPHVIVSDKLRDFLLKEQVWSSDCTVNTKMAKMAATCRSLLAKDNDGQWIMDYFGKGMHELYEQKEVCAELARKAYRFAREEEKRFTGENNAKLAKRYGQLRRYIESRLSIWGANSILRETQSE